MPDEVLVGKDEAQSAVRTAWLCCLLCAMAEALCLNYAPFAHGLRTGLDWPSWTGCRGHMLTEGK